ncbi:MAG: alanine--tRNA ligase, partial [Candidatus Dadabacteria bacterium]|nr:alanine--tRNA ligase [Candidatus Dadabacteria bacterium]
MKGYEVRREFIEYFSERGHEPVRSSILIPENDPTLLFTNAGMVQFKNVFTGNETRDFKRAVSSQKCLRAGGKHNDLDNVGYTARHHTFFEMLGNFSFGDYFKEGAINYGWDLITNVYGLPKEKLWVTVYKDDDEAFEIWNKGIGVAKKRIVRMGEKDNFWSMGDTGPCGPCSEILIDQGESLGCGKAGCAVGCECDRYLELWNLVFMQFERNQKGEMTSLPRPSIDTGLGLERLTAVLQGVGNNYETDLLRGIISRIEELSGRDYSTDRSTEVAMRVIADHSRALAFLISDGVFPSNEGRGYVLRRILRRAVRHSKFLGIDEPFIYRVLPAVEGIMADAYPEIREKGDFVPQVVKSEEERFLETVDRGLELLNQEIAKLGKKKKLPGKVVFSLYDTYGFPVDLTEDITRTEGIDIDLQGFEQLEFSHGISLL